MVQKSFHSTHYKQVKDKEVQGINEGSKLSKFKIKEQANWKWDLLREREREKEKEKEKGKERERARERERKLLNFVTLTFLIQPFVEQVLQSK